MSFRARGRFHAYREAEVAGRNRPDVIVSSASGPCEVAIEVKHGGMGWTIRQLEQALCEQLSSDYLKPPTGRHGVLLISHHGRRRWKDPESKSVTTFGEVIDRLSSIARNLTENDSGPFEVQVMGINAAGCQRVTRCDVEEINMPNSAAMRPRRPKEMKDKMVQAEHLQSVLAVVL